MIKLENINKTIDDNIILNNISLNINKGDIFGIVGYSGAGKSTLLKIMSGYLTPDSGYLLLNNQPVSNLNKKEMVRDTSMIFQGYNLLNNINVLKNVLLPIKLRRKINKEDIDKALELLSFVKMIDKKDDYIRFLSGGEKQRVAIARALITDPKIIFCDEPTSALDRNNSQIILTLLKEIKENFDTTIVVVSHDIDVIKSIANKAAIIENGKLIDVVKINSKALTGLSYKEALVDD